MVELNLDWMINRLIDLIGRLVKPLLSCVRGHGGARRGRGERYAVGVAVPSATPAPSMGGSGNSSRQGALAPLLTPTPRHRRRPPTPISPPVADAPTRT